MNQQIEYRVGVGYSHEASIPDLRRDTLLLKARCSRFGGAMIEAKEEDISSVQWEYVFQKERRARRFAWYASSFDTMQTVRFRKVNPAEAARETDTR